jgi:trigger factor
MTDEIRPDEGATAVENPPEGTDTPAEDGPKKLRQDVTMKDIGPCKKHIRVVVNQEDIQGRMKDHFDKLSHDSSLTGFRPGKAPRRLIEKRFFKDVAQQVKGEVLLASLEQLGEDHEVAPLSPPQIDPTKIELPKDGPLVYEFEVEVRPEFDLPEYKGLKLKRPVKTFTDEDVAETRRRLLADQGQIVPKEGGTVEIGDLVVADMHVKDGDKEVGKLEETTLRVERQLAFKDGIAKKFGEQISGAKAGDTRTIDVQLSQAAAGGLGGKLLHATLTVKDVKTVRLPELTEEYCEENFGVRSAEAFDELLRAALERNLAHEQRRAARMQVMEAINAAAKWDLPEDLLRRQASRAMSRRIMEMRADGIPEAEIAKRRRVLEQDILQMTAMTLKEHFVLQKIAEKEKIDVNDDDITAEIERMADQSDESPRKVRARLEKEDMMEALMAEMIERMALDLILDSAQYEDVPLDAEAAGADQISTVEVQAVEGHMTDPTAEVVTGEMPAQTPGE